MKTVVITVPDMACGHCATTVEEALRQVEGVDHVEVSLEEKLAKILAEESVGEVALADAIRAVGYTPEV